MPDEMFYDPVNVVFYDDSGNVISLAQMQSYAAMGVPLLEYGTGTLLDPNTLEPETSQTTAPTPAPVATPTPTPAASTVTAIIYDTGTKTFTDQNGNVLNQTTASQWASQGVPFYNGQTGAQINPYTLQPLTGGAVSSNLKPTVTATLGPVSAAVSAGATPTVATTPTVTPLAQQTLTQFVQANPGLLAIAAIGFVAVMVMGKKKR